MDDHAQPLAGRVQRLLDVVAGVAFGEEEAEVPVSVRERADTLAGRDGDGQAGDSRDGGRVGAALDRAERARPGDGKHEHARGTPWAGRAGVLAQGVGQHHLLQAGPAGEPQRA